MPRVFNKHRPYFSPDAVYVGHPSKWGNPYSHLEGLAEFKVSTREEALQRYREHLDAHPEIVASARAELAGKDLVCWCAPLACHADILLKISNSSSELEPTEVDPGWVVDPDEEDPDSEDDD